MRMVSRLQLIYHQVQTTLRNPIFQFERPPPNESKMICLGELKLNLHTLQDLYFGMQKQNRYNLILNQIGCMPNEESTLGTGNSCIFFCSTSTIFSRPISWLKIIKQWTVYDWLHPPGLKWFLSYLYNFNNKLWHSQSILLGEYWILICLIALFSCACLLYTPQTLRIQALLVKPDMHALITQHLSIAVLIPNHPEITIIIVISCVLLITIMMNVRTSLFVYLTHTLSPLLPPRLFKQLVSYNNSSSQQPSPTLDNALAQSLLSSELLQMDNTSNPLNYPSIEITNDDLAVDDQRNALSLLGIFLGNLPPFPLVISNLKKKEQLIGSISISGLEFGICQFIFSSESDRQKILKKSPISTNKYFICLADWEPPTPQAVASLIHVPFWIHLCDLPRKYCTIKIGDKLGSLLGQVILTTICEDISSHRLFLRIKVVLNAARPLTTDIRASHNDYPIQSSVRYENIPLICFTCGLLGHDKKHCPRKLQPSSSVSRFGPELRARRGWKQVDEITLRPLPHQPPESLWEPYYSRLNQFQVPAEDVNPLSAFINDPVLMHEPFFQQSPSASSKQDIQITSVEAVAFFQNSGPPTVPPQMFDMIPRPQGIVIREPAQEDEYLEQQSPDSVLFKDPSAVLQELTGNSLSQDEIMEEQCAIEADLLAQKLNDPSHTLALASKMVPESCKRGPDASTTKSQEGEPSSEPTPHAMDLSSGKSPEENRSDQSTKPRTRKRQNVSKKEAASKKQQLEAKKVEAASLNWLHPDK
ncbi:hypothetical protein LINGRAHAP2_LOCUS31187 [Linum grandiflorum]